MNRFIFPAQNGVVRQLHSAVDCSWKYFYQSPSPAGYQLGRFATGNGPVFVTSLDSAERIGTGMLRSTVAAAVVGSAAAFAPAALPTTGRTNGKSRCF